MWWDDSTSSQTRPTFSQTASFYKLGWSRLVLQRTLLRTRNDLAERGIATAADMGHILEVAGRWVPASPSGSAFPSRWHLTAGHLYPFGSLLSLPDARRPAEPTGVFTMGWRIHRTRSREGERLVHPLKALLNGGKAR